MYLPRVLRNCRGPSGGGTLFGVLACTTMGSPESPWLFRHPLVLFLDARGPLDQGARSRSYELGSFPPALTGGRGLQA